MINVQILMILTCLSIVFYSCSKDDGLGESQLIIDAKLVISEPSLIIVDLSKNEFELSNQRNPVSNVRLINETGSSLQVRKADSNLFKSEFDLVSNNFSLSDAFQIELSLENGDTVESEWMTYTPSQIDFSKKTSIDDDSFSFKLRFINENNSSYFVKWDAQATYSIGNFTPVFGILDDKNCSRWDDVDICSLLKETSGDDLMPKVDCDGDGFSNATECDYGTNPKENNSSIDFYTKGIDPSYVCYVTKKPELAKNFVEVISVDDPFDFETNLTFLLRTPLNHEFSETYVLHLVAEQISENQFKYLNGDLELSNFRNISDDSFSVGGFFEVTTQDTIDFIVNDESANRDLVVGCDLTTNISGFDNLCEDCLDALQGEGEVRVVRPDYWPSN